MMRATLALAALVAMSGCSKSEEDESTGESAQAEKAAPSGDVWNGPMGTTKKLVKMDLGPGGLDGMTIKAPEGAKVEEWSGVAQVNNNMGYTVWISEAKVPFAKAKETVEKGSLSKFKKFVTDEPNLIVYEVEGLTGGSVYHFTSHVKVGDKTFKCASATSINPGEAKAAKEMAKTCKTLAKG